MKRIGIGIIGCGAIAERAHMPAYARTPECRIVAVADQNLERAREMATKYGAERFFDDHVTLLSQPDIDAVSVCTPPSTHGRIVLDACKEGKHVLCEKPFALSMEEADQMIAAARKSGVVLAVGHQLRFMPHVRRVRELLSKRILGRVLTCYGEFSGGSVFFGWKTASEYYKKPGSGIDVVFNYGTHVLDLFNFLFGKALRVSGLVGQGSIENIILSDRAIVAVEYKEAYAVLNAFYTKSQSPDTNFVAIHGFEGKLSFRLDEPVIVFYKRDSIVSRLKGVREFSVGKGVDFQYPYVREIRDFIDSIQQHREPFVTGEDGRSAVELAIAARHSHESGQVVSLPLTS